MSEKNKMLDNRRYIFAYFEGTSVMHKLNPLSKLYFLILLTLLTIFMRSLIFMATMAVIMILLAMLTQISLKILIRKLRFIVLIMVTSVVLNIFFNAIPTGEEIILFYLFGLEFLPIRRLAVYFAMRAFFIVIILYTSTIIYTNSTNMRDFVYSLMRLGIPYRYCYAFMVGIRYIPLIEQEARTISLAQRARGFGHDKVTGVRKAYNLIFERLVATLVSILRKGHITSISMENRCFGIYKERTNMIKITFKAIDIVFMVLISVIFGFILIYFLGLLPLQQIPSLYQTLWKEFFG